MKKYVPRPTSSFMARKWRFNVVSTLRRNSAGFSCSIGYAPRGQSHGAVAAVVCRMAGCLVGKQVYMYLFLYGIFQKVHHCRDRRWKSECDCPWPLYSQRKGLRQRIHYVSHPALTVAGFDTRGASTSAMTAAAPDISAALGRRKPSYRPDRKRRKVRAGHRPGGYRASAVRHSKGVESAVHNACGPIYIHPPAVI